MANKEIKQNTEVETPADAMPKESVSVAPEDAAPVAAEHAEQDAAVAVSDVGNAEPEKKSNESLADRVRIVSPTKLVFKRFSVPNCRLRGLSCF